MASKLSAILTASSTNLQTVQSLVLQSGGCLEALSATHKDDPGLCSSLTGSEASEVKKVASLGFVENFPVASFSMPGWWACCRTNEDRHDQSLVFLARND